MFITSDYIDKIIQEDMPYFDLTGHLLGVFHEACHISFTTRQEGVVCGVEVANVIFARFNIKAETIAKDGDKVSAGDVIVSGAGRGSDVYAAWKPIQNVLEYASGIATKTRQMMDKAKSVNSNIAILTTRKTFPNTKWFTTNAILAGGAMPHRLGISETIVIFKQYIDYIGGFDALISNMPQLKAKAAGKKIIVEVNTYADAKAMCDAGACGVQFDKTPAKELSFIVEQLRADNPSITLFATGGINMKNVMDYAKTGVDGIITTSLYNAKPMDIGVDIVRL